MCRRLNALFGYLLVAVASLVCPEASAGPRTDRLGDPLPPDALARLGTLRLRHDSAITAVAFAPDGKTLASADADGIVRIWETTTGRELHRLRSGAPGGIGDMGAAVLTLAYSPDGKLLASAGAFHGVYLWDTATGAKRSCLGEGGDCLAFAPDGKTLAVAKPETVVWWNPATGKRLRSLAGDYGGVVSISYSPDGKTLAYACFNEEVGLCDPATGKVIRKLRKAKEENKPYRPAVAYSPDGKKLLIAEQDSYVLLDAASGKEEKRIESLLMASPPVFAPNGKFVAAMMEFGGHPWLWDWRQNKAWEFDDDRRIEGAGAIAFSPDSKLLAGGCSDGCVRIWDIARRKEVDLAGGNPLGFYPLFALSREGKRLAARDHSGQIRVWNIAEGALKHSWINDSRFFVRCLAMSPDGSRLALPGEDKSYKPTLQMLDAATGRLHGQVPVGDSTSFAAYSPDGKLLVSHAERTRKFKATEIQGPALPQHDLDLWDAATGQHVGRFNGHSDKVVAIVFSPDGKSLVTAGADHSVRIWDVRTRRERHRLKGHGGGATVSHIAFSADGTHIATGGDDDRICVWDAASGRRLQRWAVQDEESITCLALSADGKRLVANAGKGFFRLWDVASATASPPLDGHRDTVTFAAFLPDQRLLTASADGTALIWDVAALCRRRPLPSAPPRLDTNGAPLPPGIVARLGSTRLRHRQKITCAAYSPNGRILATASGEEREGLHLWDADSGKEIHRPPNGRDFSASQIAFSPNGKTLAVRSGYIVRLWDVATGVSQGIALQRSYHSGINSFAIAPDGKRLAAVQNDALTLWDLDSGELVRTFDEPLKGGDRIAFTADGAALVAAAGGTISEVEEKPLVPGTVGVWDVATGKRRRSHTGIHSTMLKLAPDGRTFTSLDADNRFHVRDALSCAELWVSNKEGPNCIYSLDGKYLLIGEGGQPFVLRESATGKEVRRSARAVNFGGSWFSLSLNGAMLAGASAPSSHRLALWDVASGRERRPFAGHRGTVTCLDFAADGRTLVSGDDEGMLCLWDVKSGKEIRVFRGSEKDITRVAVSPNGKILAYGDSGNRVRLWDATKGNEVWRFEVPRRDAASGQARMRSLAFAPDGRTLIVSSLDGTISLWDAIEHKSLRRFRGFDYCGIKTLLSPDGKFLACAGSDSTSIVTLNYPMADRLRMWNVATGLKVLEIGATKWRWIGSYAFSPDGKLLAVEETFFDAKFDSVTERRIAFYELATGKLLFHVEPGGLIVGFSPDGRYLLAGHTLWDMNNGRKCGNIDIEDTDSTVVVLSPDGRLLASIADAAILLHPMPRPARPKPLISKEISARELQTLWQDLSAPEPPRAWEAMRTLIATPRQSVPFLQTMLQPHTPVDRRRLERLLADLDSDVFAERERGRSELSKLGALAEPALRRTLDDKPSLEVRRQVLMLLEQIERQATSPESLRILRVTTVLERMGLPESLALLRRLAGGAAEARLTRESAAAVERSTRRNAQP